MQSYRSCSESRDSKGWRRFTSQSKIPIDFVMNKSQLNRDEALILLPAAARPRLCPAIRSAVPRVPRFTMQNDVGLHPLLRAFVGGRVGWPVPAFRVSHFSSSGLWNGLRPSMQVTHRCSYRVLRVASISFLSTSGSRCSFSISPQVNFFISFTQPS